MNIFCFPYAGGSSFMYSELRQKLSGVHKVIPMEYPGHGLRMGEELCDCVDSVIDDMFDQMRKKDNGLPFILLGYSLGSKLIYLLYEKFKDNVMFRRLKGIFFCASSMADIEENKDYSSMSDEELMRYTLELGGSDIETEEEKNDFRFFLPIIRNDFILYERTKNRITEMKKEPIDRKTWVMYSSDEENIECFDKFCTESPVYEYFEGGHFFIHEHCDEMASFINNMISADTAGKRS